MEDYLIRIIAKDAGVRGLACFTTEVSKEAARRHQSDATTTAALSRGLTSAALMGALLKVRQRVAIKYEGDGPLNKMLVESDAYGKIRGYAAVPELNLVNLNNVIDPYGVGKALGHGVLTVVKDLKLKDLYESAVPLITGQVDEDLEYYLNQSEQLPSAVQIGVVLDDDGEVQVSGGLLIQNLAGYEETAIHQIAERIQEMPPIDELLKAGKTPEEILSLLFGEIEYEVLEKRQVIFQCQCSRERSEQALMSLGRADLESLYDEGQAVVDCHFCHERYVFDQEDIEMILDVMLD